MEQVVTWITDNKVPVGDWMAALVEFIKGNTLNFFDILSNAIGTVVDGFTGALEWVPAPILIVACALAAYALRRSWGLAAFIVFSLLFVLNQGYWDDTMETLSLVLFSALLSPSSVCRSASRRRTGRGSLRHCGRSST